MKVEPFWLKGVVDEGRGGKEGASSASVVLMVCS